jgi:hypothetical protein
MSTDYQYDVDYNFTWNHRVLKTISEFEGSLSEDFQIVEVQYRNGIISTYCEPFTSAESIDGLRKALTQMQDALSKPVLVLEDFADLEEDEENDNA